MDQYELGVAMAVPHLSELRRHAERRRLARRIPGRTAGWHRGLASGPPSRAGRHGRAADWAGSGRGAVAAASGPGPAATEAAILGHNHHEPGMFDAGHCRACAHQAGLLDHYRRVRQEEARLQETREWAGMARRYASVALWSSGAALLLAVIALLTG
jgi:hypothetical protein